MEWNRAWTRLHGQDDPLGRMVGELLGGLVRGTRAGRGAGTAARRRGEAREGVAWTIPAAGRGAGPPVFRPVPAARPGRRGDRRPAVRTWTSARSRRRRRPCARARSACTRFTTRPRSTAFQLSRRRRRRYWRWACAQFGLEIGVLARAGEAEGQYRVIQARAPQDVGIAPGAAFDVCEAFCAEALARADCGPTAPAVRGGGLHRRPDPRGRRGLGDALLRRRRGPGWGCSPAATASWPG